MKPKDIWKSLKSRLIVIEVSAIIKNSKGEILLGKRSKLHPIAPNKWGLPGGMMDHNETLKDTAKREVAEEVGVKIKILKRSKNIYDSLPKGKWRIQSVTIPFYGKIIEGKPQPKEETSQVGWFKPSEIKNMNLAYKHKEILKKEGLLK